MCRLEETSYNAVNLVELWCHSCHFALEVYLPYIAANVRFKIVLVT